MVLESLLNPFRAERQPWTLVLLGFLYGSLAIFLSLWIFAEYASMVFVFLTVMACLPLIYKILRHEEEKDIFLTKESTILKEHSKAVYVFLTLFLGFVIAYTLWYVLLPSGFVQTLFSAQTNTIASLNQQVTGNFAQFVMMNKIFLNNVKVLIFCIIFSFLYGAGAIFILTWNASVIGVAAGNFIRTHIAQIAAKAGSTGIAAYAYVISLTVLRYAIHGIPEIAAYMIAGIAGGIISVAVIRHDFGTKNFEKILLDASDLVLISIFILFVAAILEVFVTPIFF